MTAPAYWLTFEDRPGYLLATVQGLHDSIEISIAYWQEVMTEVHQRNPARLLVQESFANNVSLAEMDQVVRFLGETLQSLNLQHLRIAFFDSRLDQLEPNLVGATNVEQYGVICKVFAVFAEAERWLLSAEPV